MNNMPAGIAEAAFQAARAWRMGDEAAALDRRQPPPRQASFERAGSARVRLVDTLDDMRSASRLWLRLCV